MPTLTVTISSGEELSFDIAGPIMTIGRNPENAIAIDEGSISGEHAQFKETSRGYALTDLDSTNGTLVNGNPANETVLAHGDLIQFGTLAATYQTEEGAAAAAPAPAADMAAPAETESMELAAAIADSSERPADFTSISPFPKKRKKQDPVGTIFLIIGFLAILASIGAAVFAAVMTAA